MTTKKLYGPARRKERQVQAAVRNGGHHPAKKRGKSGSKCLHELKDAAAILEMATNSLAVELRLPGKCLSEDAVWEGRKRLAGTLGKAMKFEGQEAIELRAKANRLFIRSLRLAEISRSRRKAHAIRKETQANGNGSRERDDLTLAPVASGQWEFSSDDEPHRRLDLDYVISDGVAHAAWDEDVYDLAHGEW